MQKLLISVFLILFSVYTSAQRISNTDKSLLMQHNKQFNLHTHNTQYIFKNSKPIVKYNPISLAFGGLMYAYQSVISPQISAQCLYENSCSVFSVQAFNNFGLIKALGLTADRLTRCNRVSALDISEDRILRNSIKVLDPIEWYK